MALKKCRECGEKISNKADSCPHCGAKNSKPNKFGCLSLIFIVMAFGFILSKIIIYTENKSEASKKELLKKNFIQKKNEIIKSIQILINDNKYSDAVSLSKPYEQLGDIELNKLAKKAAELDLYQKTLKIPAYEINKNRDAYAELVKLNPYNVEYAAKRKLYQDKIDERERPHRERVAKFGEVPVRSEWDGSYYEVEKYLKRIANDPESIDIDGCTKVFHVDEGWLVGCDYRGKNAFGALIRQSNWFIIRYGRVIAMKERNAYSM